MVPLLGSERINEIHNQDIGGEDNEIHQQADAHEVAEPVAARTIDQHVRGGADGGGKTGADTYHQCDEERIGLIT